VQLSRNNIGTRRNGVPPALALFLIVASCFPPPAGPLVDGPTLSIPIDTVSEANVTGSELRATALLDDVAQKAHADFIAANARTIGPERLVALRGARVELRPGNGVADFADAFGGLMVFVAPESDPTARVFLASAVAQAPKSPLELGLIASRPDYERAQALLTSPRFIVGVSGPTPLGGDRSVEFGLRVQLDLAIIEIIAGKGH
jgi:hypothetical protein